MDTLQLQDPIAKQIATQLRLRGFHLFTKPGISPEADTKARVTSGIEHAFRLTKGH